MAHAHTAHKGKNEMEFVERLSEEYMVASFLKGELNSLRLATLHAAELEQIRAPRSVVHTPNLESAHENALRAELLSRPRGYPDRRAARRVYAVEL